MNLYQSEENLSQAIRQFGHKLKEARQVKTRLKELLPSRLAQLKLQHRASQTAAAAQRQALVDPVYQDYIEELLDMSQAQTLNQVKYESHKMLWQARQSLRAARLLGLQQRNT